MALRVIAPRVYEARPIARDARAIPDAHPVYARNRSTPGRGRAWRGPLARL